MAASNSSPLANGAPGPETPCRIHTCISNGKCALGEAGRSTTVWLTALKG